MRAQDCFVHVSTRRQSRAVDYPAVGTSTHYERDEREHGNGSTFQSLYRILEVIQFHHMRVLLFGSRFFENMTSHVC